MLRWGLFILSKTIDELDKWRCRYKVCIVITSTTTTTMKLPKLNHTLLSLVCLSGLVSCYPVDTILPIKSGLPNGVKTPEELKAAAKKRADAENYKKTALQRSKDRLELEERNRLNAEKKEAAAYKKKYVSKKPVKPEKKYVSKKPVTKVVSKPKPKKVVLPKSVKYASGVPNKPGFVFNPYTHNQVDVRGIPSGTKVRDPHDSNPAHVFKVP